MFERINQKIEMIREEPEAVRIRYAVLMVVVSMLFVLGVWLLTIRENFRETTADSPVKKQDLDSLVSDTKSALQTETNSLQELKDSNQSLGASAPKGATGDTFFQNQLNTDGSPAENQSDQTEGVTQGN